MRKRILIAMIGVFALVDQAAGQSVSRRVSFAEYPNSADEVRDEAAPESCRHFQGHGVYRPCRYQQDDQRKPANGEKWSAPSFALLFTRATILKTRSKFR